MAPPGQECASVMVAGYVPVASPVKVVLPVTPVWVTPLTVTEYGAVPPLTLTVTLPSLLP